MLPIFIRLAMKKCLTQKMPKMPKMSKVPKINVFYLFLRHKGST